MCIRDRPILANAIADAACVTVVVQCSPAYACELHGLLNGVQHALGPGVQQCAKRSISYRLGSAWPAVAVGGY